MFRVDFQHVLQPHARRYFDDMVLRKLPKFGRLKSEVYFYTYSFKIEIVCMYTFECLKSEC